MIAVHRDYCLSNSSELHAHVKVNPVGKLEVEIVELQERHTTEFDDLSFEVEIVELQERHTTEFDDLSF
ncbi:hypothetical protein HKB36_00540, partial [Vibrio parahaemolyticus]|nr:hypothetical protein [Vibrio parahaemolyticus]